MWFNIYVLDWFVTQLLYSFIFSFMLDISLSLDPVLNLSGVPTESALALAATCERVKIAIELPADYSAEPISIPVRFEEVAFIAERGATSEKQFALISALAALMGESPLCRA